MRIVAGDAFNVRVVLIRIYAPYICPSARRIGESGVAPEALGPGPVYGEFWPLLRGMLACCVIGRPVAAFALDDCVRGLVYYFGLAGVAA